MRSYEISPNEGAPSKFKKNLKAVRTELRGVHRSGRQLVRVTLFEAPHDQDAFVMLWNKQEPEKKPLRKWRLSDRGGLVEIPLNEE